MFDARNGAKQSRRISGRQPDPRETRSLKQQRDQLDVLLGNDPAFLSLKPQYRYVIDQAFRRYGHGPKNGNDGFCWFTQQTFASEIGVEPKLVQRAFADACGLGICRRTRQRWDNSGKFANSAYQLADRFLAIGRLRPLNHRTSLSFGPSDTVVRREAVTASEAVTTPEQEQEIFSLREIEDVRLSGGSSGRATSTDSSLKRRISALELEHDNSRQRTPVSDGARFDPQAYLESLPFEKRWELERKRERLARLDARVSSDQEDVA